MNEIIKAQTLLQTPSPSGDRPSGTVMVSEEFYTADLMQLAEGRYDVYISTPSAEWRCAYIEQLAKASYRWTWKSAILKGPVFLYNGII
jgi:hypothetical protein